jgi:hypothetical protein
MAIRLTLEEKISSCLALSKIGKKWLARSWQRANFQERLFSAAVLLDCSITQRGQTPGPATVWVIESLQITGSL